MCGTIGSNSFCTSVASYVVALRFDSSCGNGVHQSGMHLANVCACGDQHIGTWKPLMVLEDQIVLQVGFAKAPHQAACLKIDIEGVPHRFVHVKTNK